MNRGEIPVYFYPQHVVPNAIAQHKTDFSDMGKFSDNLRRKYADKKRGVQNNIEFECNNCLNFFNFSYEDIFLNSSGDIQFDTEPACPRCGSNEDITFSDYGQEKIEDMLFNDQIRKEK